MSFTHQITSLLLASLLLVNVSRVPSQCTTKNSVPYHVLRNHVIKPKEMPNVVDCLQQCAQEPACRSINFYLSGVCEFNSKTKETSKEDLQHDSTGFYMQSIGTVKGDSSKQAAPASCAEVKRVHPEACSRSYWLDNVGDGNLTEQMCYMNSTHGVRSPCNVTTLSGKCCVFPFEYQGVTYNSCTDVNTSPKRPWCSFNAVYSGNWNYCVVQCPTCPTELGNCCVFPFEYDGKLFDSCTTYKESSGKYWCSLTKEYVGRWNYCV